MPITDKMIQEFIEAEGKECPYCKGQQIEGGSITVNGNVAKQKQFCASCTKEWLAVYELVAIMEI